MRCAALTLASVLLAFGSPGNLLLAQDWFVNAAGGDDADNGMTAATAFRSITQAMSVANPGDTVQVAAGSYNDTVNPDGNETFPISVPDGVALIGPGGGAATVDATGAGFAAFEVLGSAAATITFKGLTIEADTSVAGIFISGLPAMVEVLDNEITAGNGVIFAAGGGAPCANFLASGNQIDATMAGIVWSGFAITGTHSVRILDNDIAADVLGIRVCGWADTSGTLNIDAFVQDNTVLSATSTGIYAGAKASAPNAVTLVDALISKNTISQCGSGILAGAFASGTASAELGGTIECNTVTGHGAGGLAFLATASGTAFARLDPLVQFNKSTGGVSGVAGFAGSFGGASTAEFEASFRGNTLRGNTGDGVCLASSNGAGTVTLPEFGLAATKGRNTILGNGGFDFDLGGLSAGQAVQAQGNWWGVNTPAGLDPLVNDQDDNGAFGELISGTLLTNPFLISATPETVSVFSAVIAVAGAQGAFVRKAGDTELIARINGVPVLFKNVNADGSRLFFSVPTLTGFGQLVLSVINPGGQSAAFPLAVILPAQSGCFLATAAEGDNQAPGIALLRRWRDHSLSGNPLGRALVRTYYAVSPPLAQAVAERPWARAAVRAAMAPVLGSVRLWLEHGWVYGAGGVLLLLRLLRRRR